MPMLATRGCPFKCSFCSSSNMWQQKWIPRDPKLIVEEIRKYIKLYNVTNIDFYDMTTIINKEWIIKFSKLIIENNFNITWQLPSGTRAEAITKEVCDYMYEAGCRNLAFSPESASERILKQIEKKIEIKSFTLAIKEALSSKMNVKVNLIFGFPDERHRDILVNLKYIIYLSFIGVHDLSIWSFAPYPGSKIYSELRQRGRIKDFNKDYLNSLIYADIFQEVSWNDHMSVKWINFYRLIGHMFFYIFSCIFHPIRALKVIHNLFTGKHESRTEKFIAEFFKKKPEE
ncbi:MAG: radical SAM protein [Candidatus Omnitrophica bacterium]|nr:radical SAM protein [Candidatus Omnitrophota bacterium]